MDLLSVMEFKEFFRNHKLKCTGLSNTIYRSDILKPHKDVHFQKHGVRNIL